jgi:energy-coupling factor transporter ATP-binding protein EcfA2
MNVTIIGVAGGTGSGKSTLVKRLQEAFAGDAVATICHDYYYKSFPNLTYEERCKLNYDHPQAFDTDMMVESGNRAVLYQFRIAYDEKSNVVYMFEVILDDGKIKIAENPTTSSTSNRNMIGESAALGEWFNIRIEYYSDLSTPKIKIYINGTLMAVTSTFYGSHKEGATPKVGYNHASLFAPKATEAVSYFDNSYFAKIVKEYVDETPEV